ncbi:Ferredoxin 3 fused to uncharacterized domain [Candidatus Syntrophocurvum alkaliphilum]|uniref:Ferredoxin 3 fused to uncharacterized domain n=1 Tax=Candidatus Syntrophocurvum alkaliphilum TaxID=2293317 RepID=A0A6I6DIG1_9FIRM|nr:4Fe-4S binding protein [Candidatus Syntrophocurvum alkaliphilum]QGT99674.1 Ferredoxin 3 fused to uncharacterized domain [Candidatus Syntrophocurvum alkaliphilum]
MVLVKRTIVKIDEELCDGCGACISPCAEGALTLIDGKAKIIREELCDGAGFCIGVCPTGALTLEERVAEEFSELEVEKNLRQSNTTYIPQKCNFCSNTEDNKYLLPIKHKGESMWCCTRCLPRLIHG